MAITLEARNYRVLRQMSWAPASICVVVGPNGSGKTTLFNLFDLFRDAYLRGMPAALDYLGGSWGLRNLAVPAEAPVSIAITVGDLRWEIQLAIQGPAINEGHGERVTRGTEVLLSRPLLSDRLEYRGRSMPCDERLGLRMVYDADRDAELAPLVEAITTIRVYPNYNLRGLRRGSPSNSDVFLHRTGENAYTVLRNWHARRDLRPKYDYVVSALRSAFPECFTDLDFEFAGVTNSIRIYQPHNDAPVPVFFAPNGLLTGLLHLCAVVGATPGSVVAIDEMENTLHPYAIRKLVESFRDWGEEHDLTLCLASHSPVLLDEFKDSPSSIFVMEHGQENSPVPLTELCDPHWLSHFSLGRLYAHGEFGGQRGKNAVPTG